VKAQQFTHCVNCNAEKVKGLECPHCGAIYERAERIWEKRQQAQSQKNEQASSTEQEKNDLKERLDKSIKESPIFTNGGYTIDCAACKLAGGMEKRKINRFPLFIRLIGWIIATPSAVGMAVGIVVVLTNHGAGFGSDTLGLFVGGGFFMMSAVGGLVGWLLLMRKNAWVCSRCGYLMDRA
jgi:hypothetical protein